MRKKVYLAAVIALFGLSVSICGCADSSQKTPESQEMTTQTESGGIVIEDGEDQIGENEIPIDEEQQ